MKERQELYELLKADLIRSGNWDKVTILDGDYYENFLKVVEYTKGIIER